MCDSHLLSSRKSTCVAGNEALMKFPVYAPAISVCSLKEDRGRGRLAEDSASELMCLPSSSRRSNVLSDALAFRITEAIHVAVLEAALSVLLALACSQPGNFFRCLLAGLLIA